MQTIPHRLAALLTSAMLVVLPMTATAMKHTVTQSSVTFVPNTLTVVEGDTVEWVHTGGTHTVTNGTGAIDPSAGSLFDASLNSATPTFQYVFTSAGMYPYFCRPHESLGMTGTITVDLATGVRAPAIAGVTLRQNYPNPFSTVTGIEYVLPRRTSVTLGVYDARGRRVATLASGTRSVGPHSAAWDGRTEEGRSAPAGIYFYRLEADGIAVTKKLVLVR
jgi:plastocyanin